MAIIPKTCVVISFFITFVLIIRIFILKNSTKRLMPVLWGITFFVLLGSFAIGNGEILFGKYSADFTALKLIPDAKRLYVDIPIHISAMIHNVWGGGAILLFCFYLLFYFRTRAKVLNGQIIRYDFIERVCERLKLYNPPAIIIESYQIESPMVFGLLKQKVVLPAAILDMEEKDIQYVLTHELIHVKQYDNLFKLFSWLVVCAYWVNPLVWIMFYFINRDIELRCDEKVMALWGEGAKISYAKCLIKCVENRSGPAVIYCGFGESALKERIKAIGDKPRKKIFNVFVLGGMIPILGVLFMASTVWAQEFVEIQEQYVSSYPVNQNGQTYGPNNPYDLESDNPDLIEAETEEGLKGYVKKEDLYERDGPMTPEEIKKRNHELKEREIKCISIPLYAKDGVTIIGEFQMDVVGEKEEYN